MPLLPSLNDLLIKMFNFSHGLNQNMKRSKIFKFISVYLHLRWAMFSSNVRAEFNISLTKILVSQRLSHLFAFTTSGIYCSGVITKIIFGKCKLCIDIHLVKAKLTYVSIYRIEFISDFILV